MLVRKTGHYLEFCSHETIVKLFRVPLPDDKAIWINDEQISHIIIG